MSVNLTQLAFRLRRGAMRRLIGWSGNSHPTSLPFISGDTFRAVADHVFDGEPTGFSPEEVKTGDTVFVCSQNLDAFFERWHGRISVRYVLITHNGDANIDERRAAMADDRVAVWFAQNVAVRHPRIRPIPIGLENMSFYNNGLVSEFARRRGGAAERHPRILYGFSVATNPRERQPALEQLERCPTAERLGGWPALPHYLDELRRYMFVASPPGNGIDCHRTWEAMVMGVVPIVKRSVCAEEFRGLGLPLWVIDDWVEVGELDEAGLASRYHELKAGFTNSRLTFDSWHLEIQAAAEAVKKGSL